MAEDFNADVIQDLESRSRKLSIDLRRARGAVSDTKQIARNNDEPVDKRRLSRQQTRVKNLNVRLSDTDKTLKAVRAETRPVALVKGGYEVRSASGADRMIINEQRTGRQAGGKPSLMTQSKTLSQMSDAEFDQFKKDLEKPRKRGGSGGAVTKSPKGRIGGGPRRHKSIQEMLADIIN